MCSSVPIYLGRTHLRSIFFFSIFVTLIHSRANAPRSTEPLLLVHPLDEVPVLIRDYVSSDFKRRSQFARRHGEIVWQDSEFL